MVRIWSEPPLRRPIQVIDDGLEVVQATFQSQTTTHNAAQHFAATSQNGGIPGRAASGQMPAQVQEENMVL